MKLDNLTDIKRNLNQFLLRYRITPHALTGQSPCALFMGRTPKTKLDLIHESTDNLERKQNKMIEKGPKVIRNFEVNDYVWYVNHMRSKGSPTFSEGQILRQSAHNTYQIINLEGDIVFRNVDDIKIRRDTPGKNDHVIVHNNEKAEGAFALVGDTTCSNLMTPCNDPVQNTSCSSTHNNPQPVSRSGYSNHSNGNNHRGGLYGGNNGRNSNTNVHNNNNFNNINNNNGNHLANNNRPLNTYNRAAPRKRMPAERFGYQVNHQLAANEDEEMEEDFQNKRTIIFTPMNNVAPSAHLVPTEEGALPYINGTE